MDGQDNSSFEQRERDQVYHAFFQRIVEFLATLLQRFSPNTITLFAVALGGSGLAVSALWSWPAGFALLMTSMIFDAVDGYIARKTGQTSETGKFLDAVADEINDTFMFVAVAAAGMGSWTILLLALVVKLLVSSAGLSAQSVGVSTYAVGLIKRYNRGLLFFAFGIASLVTKEVPYYPELKLMDLFGLIMLALGLISLTQRIAFTLKETRGR